MASPNGSVYRMLTAILTTALLSGGTTWFVFGSNTVTREELRQELQAKANKETIEAELGNIAGQLRLINARLERMEGNDD